jgi:hypothetical protein
MKNSLYRLFKVFDKKNMVTNFKFIEKIMGQKGPPCEWNES